MLSGLGAGDSGSFCARQYNNDSGGSNYIQVFLFDNDLNLTFLDTSPWNNIITSGTTCTSSGGVFSCPAPTPSVTPSLTPSVTPSRTPSLTPSVTPSLTPSLTPTPSCPPCYNYLIEGTGGNEVFYTQCDGTSSNFSVSNGSSITICARPDTITFLNPSPAPNVTQQSQCGNQC
jgi:hypothetical protein